MSNSEVNRDDIEWLQNQIYDLVNRVQDLETTIELLQMENTLLQNDLNTIKTEGCWRFIEDATHRHRSSNE